MEFETNDLNTFRTNIRAVVIQTSKLVVSSYKANGLNVFLRDSHTHRKQNKETIENNTRMEYGF